MKHLNEIELVMALDGEMEAQELALARAHVSECAECGAQFEKLRGTSERVREYQLSLDSHPSLHMRVAQGGAPEKVSSFGFRVSSWGFAAAAVVFVTLTTYFVSHPSGRGGRQSVAPDTSHSNPTARSFVAKSAPQDDNSCQSGATKSIADCAGSSHPSRKGSAQSGAPTRGGAAKNVKAHTKTPSAAKPDRQLAQFTELPFSDTSLPLEEATVVRVQLPAAALRQAGVPVEEDSAGAMLQADVVLGLDGLPRGIRLVKNAVANHAGTN